MRIFLLLFSILFTLTLRAQDHFVEDISTFFCPCDTIDNPDSCQKELTGHGYTFKVYKSTFEWSAKKPFPFKLHADSACVIYYYKGNFRIPGLEDSLQGKARTFILNYTSEKKAVHDFKMLCDRFDFQMYDTGSKDYSYYNKNIFEKGINEIVYIKQELSLCYQKINCELEWNHCKQQIWQIIVGYYL